MQVTEPRSRRPSRRRGDPETVRRVPTAPTKRHANINCDVLWLRCERVRSEEISPKAGDTEPRGSRIPRGAPGYYQSPTAQRTWTPHVTTLIRRPIAPPSLVGASIDRPVAAREPLPNASLLPDCGRRRDPVAFTAPRLWLSGVAVTFTQSLV
jgi:hypothetical protein